MKSETPDYDVCTTYVVRHDGCTDAKYGRLHPCCGADHCQRVSALLRPDSVSRSYSQELHVSMPQTMPTSCRSYAEEKWWTFRRRSKVMWRV